MDQPPAAFEGLGGEALPPEGSSCLGPDEIVGFVQGWLEGDEWARAEAHIDQCDECRRCVSAMAKEAGGRVLGATQAATPGLSHSRSAAVAAFDASERQLARGTVLERYVIDGVLGVGGMGVVYAAFDPKLDRKVALKMLRVGATEGPEARERLLREGRVMARLSHPNVVNVYDVGAHEGQLFLAMEYVDGVTLRSWLRRESRPAREVLGALLQAGRALAAAHAVGVVHRDVKPDNMLCDRQGHVRVTDFGLARAAPAPAPAPAPSEQGVPADAFDPDPTRPGALLGTPAYMAPEQHLGRPADASSDQFSFCVVLYEALYRQRPFEGHTWPALREAVTSGRLREPPGRADVPSRVSKALLRGLSVDPEKRFDSMAELLAALDDEPKGRRRVAAAFGLVAVFAVALPLARGRTPADARPTCQGAERRLAGVWGAERKGAVRDALLATGKPFAPDAWRGVERALDAYARDWAAVHADACEATHVRGEQSAELLDLRMACLDERSKELEALTEVFARADAEVAAKAVGAAQSLSPLAPCSDAKGLRGRARPPDDAAVAAKVAALRDGLVRAQALRDAGKVREALGLTTEALRAAEALGHPPSLAEALTRHGELQGLAGDDKGSAVTLKRAVVTAESAGDEATRARAWAYLFVATYFQEGYDHAFLNDQAAAASARVGGNPEVDLLRHVTWARFLVNEERNPDRALGEYEAALALAEKELGPANRYTLMCLNGIGLAHAARGAYDAAEAALLRGLAIGEGTFGPHHPQLSILFNALGVVSAEQLRFVEATAYFERDLRLLEGSFGEASPKLISPLVNVGDMLNEQGHYERAAPYFQRAMALSEGHWEPDDPRVLFPLAGLGQAYLGAGDRPRALAYLERAARLPEIGETAAELAQARFTLALALTDSRRDRRRAHALALGARDGLRAKGTSPVDARRLRVVEQWLERHPR